jgi:hypothetical protein
MEQVYAPLATAIMTGNMELFDKNLEKHSQLLISKGTWLILERCRSLVIRSLFKSVSDVVGDTRVPFIYFLKALQFSQGSATNEQVECWLVNMIDKGFIKGYLSHEKQTAVLSQKSAFPDISTITTAL